MRLLTQFIACVLNIKRETIIKLCDQLSLIKDVQREGKPSNIGLY